MQKAPDRDDLHNPDKLREELFQWWGENVAGQGGRKALHIYYETTPVGAFFGWRISERPPQKLHCISFDCSSKLISRIFSLWCTEDINTFDPLIHIREILIVENFTGGLMGYNGIIDDDANYNTGVRQRIPLVVMERLLREMKPFNATICFTNTYAGVYRVFLYDQLWCTISKNHRILYKVSKDDISDSNKYSPSRKIQGIISRVFGI